ncbi:C6 zinc finger domain-containing protein [Colletotrichum karsti]|uniref:C6 zinc finger domain-containing protein n=1 Tax=Colletotrichum karsti TaxID=1095194 RepID=A0A9P6IF35_9PEZI|nr:C6 zinc finger domain-containing protein [Colletotrichum karsti]KAF9880736.1 C6 zinc finger domain-containing protein [Colletotrichum karsti]
MDPGQPDSKRPRLSTTNSWSPTGAPQHQLPPLHPPSSLPPTPHQAHHPGPPPPIPPYHQSQPPPPYPPPPRSAEPHHPPHPAQQHPDERRHHDQESPYNTPMQEHYRHPASPSPAHPSYNPFPHRDPGSVKREPHEDGLPHPRRPHSTGGAPNDGLPPPGPHPPPHSAPPPVPPYSDDPRRPPHMSYESAPPQMPPTPGGYRSYPGPPPPISQPPPPAPPQQYEQPPYHPQPAPESLYISSYASTQKRKATRASQACDSCRQLKAKCDETKPCKSCREKGVECKYRDPVPKAMDKTQTDILDAILEMRNGLEKKIDEYNESISRRVSILENASPYKRVKVEGDHMATTPSPPKQKVHLSPENHYQSVEDNRSEETMPIPVSDPIMSPIDEPEEPEEEYHPPGPAVAPGAPAIPVNHTTTTGHLLRWPAIRELTRRAFLQNGIKHMEDYPQGYEESRGILRLFGCGEGHGLKFDTSSKNNVDPEAIRATIDTADDNLGEPVASPSPSAEAWGQVGSLSPPNLMAGSVLTPDGHPDYSEEKVWAYVESFEKHVMSLHPIITPNDLKPLVKRFLKHVTTGKPKPAPTSTAKFAVTTADYSNKRKRSPSGDQPDDPVQNSRKQGRPARTIEVALVLMVMGLGKICRWKGKLPEPAPDTVEPSQNSPLNRNGHPSSPGPGGQASPPVYSAHSQSSGLPSPKEQNNGIPSRRPSLHGSAKGGRPARNFDILPGLEYVAVASDIIGNQRGANTLKHVQVHILAGLYYGLLGRPIESYRCLADADVSLHHLMRRDMDRYQKICNLAKTGVKTELDRRDTMIIINFWSCSQLQGDIIAELGVYPSNCNKYDDSVPWPNALIMGNELPFHEVQHYMAQLYLRKALNSLHGELYKPSDVTPMDIKLSKISGLDKTLRSMEWARGLSFSEQDPPANTFLEARLRAKYWGTQVITYRPFVKLVLDISAKLQQRTDGATPNSDTAGGLGLFTKGDATAFVGHGIESHQDLVNTDTIQYAKRCIEALFKSTESFHNVDHERLLVTNIFGTALAQWGNLLTLSAAYKDPCLGPFVDAQRLQYNLSRTIQMLHLHASEKSSLKINQRILEHIQKDLFRNGGAYEDPRATISFSSAASAASMSGPTLPPPPPPPAPAPMSAPNHHPTDHQGPMGLAYAMEPHRSAHNSPIAGHRVLNHAPNHNHTPNHTYQG